MEILEYVRPYIEDELDLYFKENPVETVYKRYQELAISNYLDIVAMHKLEYMHDYLLKYYTGHINYLFNCGKSHSIESRLKDIKELYDRHNNKYSIEDFEEYIKTVNGMNLQSACFNYIFERNLNNKSILTLYLENTKKIPASTKKIVKALMASMSSIFEVKRVLQNGFDF